MKQIRLRSVILPILIILFASCGAFFIFEYGVYGDNWAKWPSNRHLYNNGKLFKAGTITDRNGIILAETIDSDRYFNGDKQIRMATIHAVGDLEGKVSTGAHSAFWRKLTGYELLNGAYNMSGKGNDMQLTLDANLCVAAMKELGRYSGTVGIMNYKTGEIICMVSTKTFDPNNPPADGTDGIYVNRLLSGRYAPGSIFKLVTATAAIDYIPDIFERTFTCSLGVEIEGEWVSCLHRHGQISFKDALIHSCNSTFAQLAVELGKDKMTKTAEKLGFNKTIKVDGIKCARSSYEVGGARNIDLAWSGMGQYNVIVNPMQYLRFVAAIASEGVAPNPTFVKRVTTPYGVSINYKLFNGGDRLLSKSTANTLSDMMRNNVLYNYGESNFKGLELCAKTGTAEIGELRPHSWFVGFSRTKPYAFVVVAENAGSGIAVAGRIASRMLAQLP